MFLYRTLELIPVNGATLPVDAAALQQQLNAIYSQAVVQWVVRPGPALAVTYDTNNNGLEYGTSGLLSNYTVEMRTVLSAYTRDRIFAPDTYYLFVVPKADDNAVTGYMPRKRPAGFVFANNLTAATTAKVIAHELAHGAFRLAHSFPPLPENGTNLMDYSATGTQLHKHQWDEVHNPVAVLGLFEGDEEGAMNLFFNKDLVAELLRVIHKSNDDSDKRLSINVFSPQSVFTMKHSASFIDFSIDGLNLKNLKVTVTRTSDIVHDFLVNPAQILKTTIPGNNEDTYLKYKFLPLNKDNDNYIPNSLIKENAILEIEINREDEFAFETYLFNVMRPLPGDPLMEMRVVHTNTAPTSGGMFGCARLDPVESCTNTTIPNLPLYTGMNKVHDGIDVYAALDTDVFAMYEGTVQFVENTVPANTKGSAGDFGNRIRISSTPDQHRIPNKNFTIYTYYTHLNQVGSNIVVGTFIRQGELLGKTGRTGNAFNIPIERYHTHICIYRDGTNSNDRIDPRPYFNTQFDLNGNITN